MAQTIRGTASARTEARIGMSIVPENNEMIQNRNWLTSVVSRVHLSLGMAVLMFLVAAAIEGDAARFQGLAVSNWIADKFALLGMYVTADTWKWLMVVFGSIIAYSRPTPTTAFYLSWPLVAYGGFLAWYGIEAQRLPLPVMILMVWGFIVTLVLMIAWPTLIQAVVENVELKKQTNGTLLSPADPVKNEPARSQP